MVYKPKVIGASRGVGADESCQKTTTNLLLGFELHIHLVLLSILVGTWDCSVAYDILKRKCVYQENSHYKYECYIIIYVNTKATWNIS